ncbi:MFS transporter [Lonsdalea quercina]
MIKKCRSRYHDDGMEMFVAMKPSSTAQTSIPSQEEGLPGSRRVWAVLSVSLAVVLSVLDGTLANVALPTIAHSLNASAQTSVWVVNGYQLAIIATLLPMAALGEFISYRKVFSAGVVVFTLSSLGCAMADSMSGLIAARVIQGVGAAAVMCCTSALLRHTYPAKTFGRGLARNAFVVTASSAAGPSICAAVLSVAPWEWLFVINFPIGILALVCARALPMTPRQPRKFDLQAIVLNALGMSLGVIGLNELNHSPPLALTLILSAALCLWRLVNRCLGDDSPLLPLDLFKIPRFRWAIAASFCMFAAQMCAFVALPFYMQHSLGRTIVQTGLLMTAWPVGSSLANLGLSSFVDRVQAGSLCATGAGLQIIGLILIVALPHGTRDLWLLCGLFLAGVGFGFFQSPNSRDMLSAPPRSRSGAAGGMQAAARVNGQAWGTALAGLCFSLSASEGDDLALSASIGFSLIALLLNLRRRRLFQTAPLAD